jgi:hypothetical protein
LLAQREEHAHRGRRRPPQHRPTHDLRIAHPPASHSDPPPGIHDHEPFLSSGKNAFPLRGRTKIHFGSHRHYRTWWATRTSCLTRWEEWRSLV